MKFKQSDYGNPIQTGILTKQSGLIYTCFMCLFISVYIVYPYEV